MRLLFVSMLQCLRLAAAVLKVPMLIGALLPVPVAGWCVECGAMSIASYRRDSR